jgi:purine-binding chemotaxis protein CheW
MMENYQEQAQAPQETLARLELLQQLKETEVAEIEDAAIQLVVISLDGDLYGIKILAVREILKIPHITRLPCAPDYIIGVMSVRGDVHAVVNLKNFLHLGDSAITNQSRIIMVETEGLVTGMLIDAMVDIIHVPETRFLPLSDNTYSAIQQYVEGKLRWNDEFITLLRIETIIQNIVVDQT